MPELTRNQAMMKQAIENVKSLEKQSREAQKIYGGLCHKFPVLVRTCGLCQAVAFMESKESSSDDNRKRAHNSLTEHITAVLKSDHFTVNGKPSVTIASLPMRDYTRATRLLLAAWIYYKRFAESILKVEAADQEGNNGGA